MEHRDRPPVVLFATGGTIASASPAEKSGAEVTLRGEDLVRGAPGVDSVASLRVRPFRQVPSGDLTMTDVLELTEEIRDTIDAGAKGIVVTRGTDTLEEVSFVLDLLKDVISRTFAEAMTTRDHIVVGSQT